MKVFPQYNGPMALWPQVEAVAGAQAALEQLAGRCQMIVASNAGDSRAPEVQQALDRVGLGGYFKAVFTGYELGSRKPEPDFYRRIESVLGRSPHEITMIGDSYKLDVLGAKLAGWRSAWFNSGQQSAPGNLPLHDLEFQSMDGLPEGLCRPALPDYPTCLAWLNSQETPHHLLAHIQLVASTAYTLAVWLRQKGALLDPILVHRGGMLHDLAKMDSIRRRGQGAGGSEDHAGAGAALLRSFGQPELAEIANRHMPYQDSGDPRRPISWEQKLVHFADKLAEGAQLVSLDERFKALKNRYPRFAKQIDSSRPRLAELEQEICARLETGPAELLSALRSALHGEY